MKVLIAEDEESFVEALALGLKREGFEVLVARDGKEALSAFEDLRPDIILLDVMLPVMNGLDVLREIRTKSRVPVIVVSAKTSEIDTVLGLEIGADDYVAKPYRIRELVARIRAVVRRREEENDADLEPSVISVGDVSLDLDRHVAIIRGEEMQIPLKEFELLEVLLINAGRVVPRETLFDVVWGNDFLGESKTLDVHIKRLRSKVERDPSNPAIITTVRGVGYRYEKPARSEIQESS